MKRVHVLPINDLKPHSETGTSCECLPKVKQVEGGVIIVHNSWDGREITEGAVDYSFSVGGKN